MTDNGDLASAPISPSLPTTHLRASGLGVRGGSSQDTVVQRNEQVNAGEADEGTIDAEDVQPQQILKTPELPSRAEIEAHRIDHWPYRSWCDECVEGFGRERVHAHGDCKVAMISMDYGFVTSKGPIVSEGEDGWNDPESLKLLIVKDSKSGSVFAHAEVQEGIDEKRLAVDMVVRDVLWLGYSQALLKSDNEPAIVKLLQESLGVLKVKGVQAGEEHSPPYDSQANGAVESAVKQIKGRLRTMKLCLERRIKKRIPPRHPLRRRTIAVATKIHRPTIVTRLHKCIDQRMPNRHLVIEMIRAQCMRKKNRLPPATRR